jgi:hypothetical protein
VQQCQSIASPNAATHSPLAGDDTTGLDDAVNCLYYPHKTHCRQCPRTLHVHGAYTVPRPAHLKAVRLDLPLDLHSQLAVLATYQGVSMATLVRQLVQDHVASKAAVLEAWERFRQEASSGPVPPKPGVHKSAQKDASTADATACEPIRKKVRRQG